MSTLDSRPVQTEFKSKRKDAATTPRKRRHGNDKSEGLRKRRNMAKQNKGQDHWQATRKKKGKARNMRKINRRAKVEESALPEDATPAAAARDSEDSHSDAAPTTPLKKQVPGVKASMTDMTRLTLPSPPAPAGPPSEVSTLAPVVEDPEENDTEDLDANDGFDTPLVNTQSSPARKQKTVTRSHTTAQTKKKLRRAKRGQQARKNKAVSHGSNKGWKKRRKAARRAKTEMHFDGMITSDSTPTPPPAEPASCGAQKAGEWVSLPNKGDCSELPGVISVKDTQEAEEEALDAAEDEEDSRLEQEQAADFSPQYINAEAPKVGRSHTKNVNNKKKLRRARRGADVLKKWAVSHSVRNKEWKNRRRAARRAKDELHIDMNPNSDFLTPAPPATENTGKWVAIKTKGDCAERASSDSESERVKKQEEDAFEKGEVVAGKVTSMESEPVEQSNAFKALQTKRRRGRNRHRYPRWRRNRYKKKLQQEKERAAAAAAGKDQETSPTGQQEPNEDKVENLATEAPAQAPPSPANRRRRRGGRRYRPNKQKIVPATGGEKSAAPVVNEPAAPATANAQNGPTTPPGSKPRSRRHFRRRGRRNKNKAQKPEQEEQTNAATEEQNTFLTPKKKRRPRNRYRNKNKSTPGTQKKGEATATTRHGQNTSVTVGAQDAPTTEANDNTVEKKEYKKRRNNNRRRYGKKSLVWKAKNAKRQEVNQNGFCQVELRTPVRAHTSWNHVTGPTVVDL